MDSGKPKVYFTKEITPEKIVEMYKILNKELPGRIGVKVHTGEAGNKNFLRPELMKNMVEFVNGTIIETNTQSDFSKRFTTESHKKVIEEHGWSKLFKVEILDEFGEMELKNENGFQIKKNFVGSKTKDFDSILVLSHFKGHGMGGYGGALKQLSIGFASSLGKRYIHTAGKCREQPNFREFFAESVAFKQAMADAAKTVVDFYKGNMAFINIMKNISVDCDCLGASAKPPCMKDIGILSSLDPVAVDQACIDLIYKSDDPGKKELIERIEQKDGIKIIEASVALGTGKREYELINLD
ncbi:MAG: DUF362 domain-containing protein [archaeon]|nr:DUF362 domain-containing protein [archaeon]